MIVGRIHIRFRVDEDIAISSFSSKVSKSIVIKSLGEDHPIFSAKPNKPYVITPIFFNNTPLIRSVSDSDNLKLSKDKEYNFSFTALDLDILKRIMDIGSIELFNTRFKLLDYELEVKTFRSLMIDGNKINMKFITPLLLQLPIKWSGVKRKRDLLFPIPSLMLWPLISHWNTYVLEELKIVNEKSLATFSNYAMREFNYNIKPLHIVYDARKPMGIVGWIQFIIDANDNEYATMLKRLLAYANYFGLGRGRAIGFGMVDIKRIS